MALQEHRIRELETKFQKLTGHKHTGAEGDAPLITGLAMAFTNTTTGLTWTAATSTLSLSTGYVIPTTTQQSAWHAALTLAAIGSTPNANGMTLSTQQLNLQPADGTYGGIVSTSAQTFAGGKTFTSWFSSKNFTTSYHYTGFPNRTDTSLAFVAGVSGATRTLTLTCAGKTIWVNGVEYTLAANLTKQIADVTGLYWFWITAPGGVPQLNGSTDVPLNGYAGARAGFDQCLVATVYWNTTTDLGILSDERHWVGRDCWWHEYSHETIGARWYTGGTITPTDTTFSITQCEFYDDDIQHILAADTKCRVLYHNGDAAWDWTDNSATPYLLNGTSMRYNNGTALTDVDTGKFVCYWIYATNSVTYPFKSVMGNAQSTTIAAARLLTPPSFGALASAEVKLLYKLIFRQNASDVTYMEAADFRQSQTLGLTYIPADHSILSNLDYAVSGHTGFAATTDLHDILTLGVSHGSISLANQVLSWDGVALSCSGNALTATTAGSTTTVTGGSAGQVYGAAGWIAINTLADVASAAKAITLYGGNGGEILVANGSGADGTWTALSATTVGTSGTCTGHAAVADALDAASAYGCLSLDGTSFIKSSAGYVTAYTYMTAGSYVSATTYLQAGTLLKLQSTVNVGKYLSIDNPLINNADWTLHLPDAWTTGQYVKVAVSSQTVTLSTVDPATDTNIVLTNQVFN